MALHRRTAEQHAERLRLTLRSRLRLARQPHRTRNGNPAGLHSWWLLAAAAAGAAVAAWFCTAAGARRRARGRTLARTLDKAQTLQNTLGPPQDARNDPTLGTFTRSRHAEKRTSKRHHKENGATVMQNISTEILRDILFIFIIINTLVHCDIWLFSTYQPVT